MATINPQLHKIIFWDYGPGAMEKLPVETVAQRLIDRWALIDEAFRNKEVSRAEMLYMLEKINAHKEAVYCESVREHVIKYLIGKYVTNTSPSSY